MVFSFLTESQLLTSAFQLVELAGEDSYTDFGTNTFLTGVELAQILQTLKMDDQTIAAGLLYPTVVATDLGAAEVSGQVSKVVASLVVGVEQLKAIELFQSSAGKNVTLQTDNMRKMLLAMAQDVRVVVIKIVDHLSKLRACKDQPETVRQDIALATQHIYAPLAARLGLEKVKWELEDLAFRELDPHHYHFVAGKLAEKRVDREKRIEAILALLQEEAHAAKIHDPIIYGRPKHLYSIYKKMERKELAFEDIFDTSAVRIIVDDEKSCYKMLSFVHQAWTPIVQEFEDYIANPKPNGYRSIHTAIIDSSGRSCEVQIRTRAMHDQAENGIAAHWRYKELKQSYSNFDEKIDWLRSLLDWYKDIARHDDIPEALDQNILDDRIYVFTPNGDVLDLPKGSTPLDFAYQVHTEVGHRCRGAKIDGNIVPLTQPLKTSDRVEVITAKNGTPSRDWLIAQRGYLRTASARTKVAAWFKKQDAARHLADGYSLLDRECKRLKLSIADYPKAAKLLQFPSSDKMLIALGNGSLRLAQVIQVLVKGQAEAIPADSAAFVVGKELRPSSVNREILVSGVGHLLSHLAKCCKPVPGDPILGYITQGRGVAVHHRDCNNIAYAAKTHRHRIIEVSWNLAAAKMYPVDLEMVVENRQNILRDITSQLSNNKINILTFNTATDQQGDMAKVFLTIEINTLEHLGKILDHLSQISHVIEVKRM